MSVLIQKAFTQLYPNKEYKYIAKLSYSNRFSDYNANMRFHNVQQLEANLSKKWRGVNEDIVIGLIQTLLLKVFKGKKSPTVNIDLYNLFIKNLHLAAPKNNIDPTLELSFHKLNAQFFNSQIELPNLCWGQYSRRKLGSYDFQTDTIILSRVFQHTTKDLLEYVLYHEMLHKHFKFTNTACKTTFHSKAFREAEKKFPNAEKLDKSLRFLPKTPKQASFLSNFVKMFWTL